MKLLQASVIGLAMAAVATATYAAVPVISFDKAFYSKKENAGSVTVVLTTSAAPTDTATVEISLNAGGTAVAGTDFTFATQNFMWPKDSAGTRSFTIPILDNATPQTDRFFVLDIKSPVNATIGSKKRLVVYLLDDDTMAPVGTDELGMRFVSSFLVDSNGTAEIVDFDATSKRLFVMNSTRTRLEILDFKNPAAIVKINTIDLSAHGAGATSVAVMDGIVAVAIVGAGNDNGKVAFLDTNGVLLKTVTVGNLPDMLTWSPNCRYLLSANEGQPNAAYTFDPEGSISIIDLQGGIDSLTQEDVVTMNFNAFDAQKAALKAQGIRIFGPGASVSQDLEPEYITVSKDSRFAYITLQEANAIAKADLETKTITGIYPLGSKDHSLARNAFDVSDQLDSVFMAQWPVRGLYTPDGIAYFSHESIPYLITANEGDTRDYAGLKEEKKVGDASYKLDSAAFPNADILKLNTNLGRLVVAGLDGDKDGDGDMDTIFTFGARSITIWDASLGTKVWDSGDDFERILSQHPTWKSLFNASHDNNTRKNRSDNKGPEPEGVTIGMFAGKRYAFVTLERAGGVMVYDISVPSAPRYVTYANSRTLGSVGGDRGPEGIIFISEEDSPNDTALVVLANEVSATVSVYSLAGEPPSFVSQRSANKTEKVRLHKILSDRNLIVFSKPVDFKLADARGRVVREGKSAPLVDLSGMRVGRYFLKVKGSGSFRVDVTK